MTCIFCAFENPDAETHCFRCGRSLDTDSIDAVPDRLKRGRPSNQPFSGLAIRWRLWHQRRRLRRRREEGGEVSEVDLLQRPAWMYGLLSLFPGFGQYAADLPLRGLVCLCIWLVVVLSRFLFAPPAHWSLSIAMHWFMRADLLATLVHVLIIMDAYWMAPVRPRDGWRLWTQMTSLSLVAWGLITLSQAFFAVAAPYRLVSLSIALDDPTIRRGDVLSIWPLSPSWPLKRGCIVSYDSNRIVTYRMQGQVYYDGEIPGVVMGLPGEVMKFEDGCLWADGQKLKTPDWVASSLQDKSSLRLGAKQYLVVPWLNLGAVPSLASLIALRDELRGEITDIVDPPFRRRRLRVR